MSSPQSGDRINNFLLEELIGTGSFGQVWRARHHMFDERVAIKIPTDAHYVQNLRREGVTIHGLRHPNIVRAIDLDPYADPPYLIMELVPGASLRQFIDAYPKGMPIEATVAVMRGVLDALAVAHDAGVIHRDVKPANLLLTQTVAEIADLTAQSVKVADFGLGHVGGAMTQSIMQSANDLKGRGPGIAGTLAYMAPEAKEGKEIDGRSDLYSCGIVLFEMLTGERPQGAEFPSGLRANVPAYLDDVFKRCYVRRERRFANVSEMIAALSLSQPPPPPPLPPSIAGAAGLKCPSCHGTVDRDDQFCIRCGQQLVDSVPRCGACDAFVQASDRFCIFCGTDLGVKT